MVWRPPSRRNPLAALRRVVEAPVSGRTDRPMGTGRLSQVALLDAPPPPPWESRRQPLPRRPPPSERSHRRPEQAAQAVITSTPAGDPGGATLAITPRPAPERPEPQEGRRPSPAGPHRQASVPTGRRPPQPPLPRRPVPLPELVPHDPAGPWTTAREAPRTTPTWLRSSPRSALGGATAAATGTSALRSGPAPLVDSGPLPPGDGTGRRLVTAKQAGAAMLVGLTAWSLLDAPDLYHSAQTAPLGARRTAALDVLHPLTRVSAALGLDRVTHLADDLLGRRPHVPAPLHLAPLAPPAGPVARPAPSHPAGLAPLRVPTAANPLRVLAVGDSIGLTFGQSVATTLDATNVARVTVDGREGTGLARPDAFDWAGQIRADIVQFHPEVVVVMFGGNDDQDLQAGGRDVPFGSPQWRQLYATRVQTFAAAVSTGGARLLWAGLPVMRSAAKTARFATVMAVTRAALSSAPGALFVDNAASLAGPSGQYVDALPNGSGQQVIVREPDGIHLSPAGGSRLAAAAIRAMTTQWHLDLTGRPPQA